MTARRETIQNLNQALLRIEQGESGFSKIEAYKAEKLLRHLLNGLKES